MRKNSYLLILTILIISCIFVTGCEKPDAGDQFSDIDKNDTSAGISAAYEAYLDILEENSDGIRAYWWQYGVNNDNDFYGVYEIGDIVDDPQNKCVAFCDLTGDEIPELLFMTYDGENSAVLRIYTYNHDEALEYICLDPPERTSGNSTALEDYYVAAGVRYMIYTGKEKGTFYIATREGDAYSSYRITKYGMTDDTSFEAVGSVYDRYETYGDENGEMVVEDEYEIDGQPVSMEEGINEFKQLSSSYAQLVMCAGYVEDMKVFEHVKTDQPLAMNYSEAVEYARSQKGTTGAESADM